MGESTPSKEHLDKLILMVMDLKNIDIKNNTEDQPLIVSYSLPSFYKNSVETLLHEKDNVSFIIQ